MTKQQEILALDIFIATLGPNSYLGPWLADNREAIVADIGSDCAIDLQLPGAARHTARGIVESARQEAQAIREQARQEAERVRAEASRQGEERRQHVALIIERAAADAVGRLTGRRS